MAKHKCNDWEALLRYYDINIEGGAELVAVANLITGLI